MLGVINNTTKSMVLSELVHALNFSCNGSCNDSGGNKSDDNGGARTTMQLRCGGNNQQHKDKVRYGRKMIKMVGRDEEEDPEERNQQWTAIICKMLGTSIPSSLAGCVEINSFPVHYTEGK